MFEFDTFGGGELPSDRSAAIIAPVGPAGADLLEQRRVMAQRQVAPAARDHVRIRVDRQEVHERKAEANDCLQEPLVV